MTETLSKMILEALLKTRRHLDSGAVDDIESFVLGQMCDDGGFHGRHKKSDLYYSSFAIAILTAMGTDFPADRTRKYLAGFYDDENLDFVHLTCLERCLSLMELQRILHKTPWNAHGKLLRLIELLPNRMKTLAVPETTNILQKINRFGSKDGTFNKEMKDSPVGTVYDTFLAMLAHQDAGLMVSNGNQIVESIKKLRLADGSYGNAPSIPSGTTTVTAAALIILSQLGDGIDHGAVRWLMDRIHPRGGFTANPQTTIADLLSTSTALLALKTVSSDISGLKSKCLEFTDLLWSSNGGFFASIMDQMPDCEYTFYGLLTIGTLMD